MANPKTLKKYECVDLRFIHAVMTEDWGYVNTVLVLQSQLIEELEAERNEAKRQQMILKLDTIWY